MGALYQLECFEFREKGFHPGVGWQRTTLHIIFDVKQDLRRKARLVAGGHLVDVLDNAVRHGQCSYTPDFVQLQCSCRLHVQLHYTTLALSFKMLILCDRIHIFQYVQVFILFTFRYARSTNFPFMRNIIDILFLVCRKITII